MDSQGSVRVAVLGHSSLFVRTGGPKSQVIRALNSSCHEGLTMEVRWSSKVKALINTNNRDATTFSFNRLKRSTILFAFAKARMGHCHVCRLEAFLSFEHRQLTYLVYQRPCNSCLCSRLTLAHDCSVNLAGVLHISMHCCCCACCV